MASRSCAGRCGAREIGGHAVELLPLYHPAAALYNARLLPVLDDDVRRLGELLGRSVAAPAATAAEIAVPPEPPVPATVATPDEQQLGLF